MHIHEAVVAPIAAFVYCNRQAPPAGATAGDKLNAPVHAPVNSAHDDANTFDRQLNSADGRSSAKIILFYFMMEPRVQ